MAPLCFEDFPVGETVEYGRYPVSAEEIIAFAREYDPQEFHLNPNSAKAAMLGGHAASGWHTAAMGMRINYDGFVRDSDSWGGPGIEELKWLRPVRPGDVLSVRRKTLSKRVSLSRPQMGFVEFVIDTLNQRGETVMTQHWFMMVGLRLRGAATSAAAPRGAAPVAEAEASAAPMPEGAVYLDDLKPGMRRPMGDFTFTAPDIIRFARAFDPQPFHLSEEGAAASHFGRLAASGWHTACVWMRLMIDARGRSDAAALARGLTLPEPGPSPGFRDLRWIAPVYAGDTLTFDSTITGARPSASRPGWGLVFFHNTGVNQHGVKVFSFEGSTFWQRRP